MAYCKPKLTLREAELSRSILASHLDGTRLSTLTGSERRAVESAIAKIDSEKRGMTRA